MPVFCVGVWECTSQERPVLGRSLLSARPLRPITFTKTLVTTILAYMDLENRGLPIPSEII